MKTTDVFHVSHTWGRPAFSALEDEIHTLLEMAEGYRWGTVDIEPNSAMAMEYYREAAELGDWEAMGLLADMLEEQGRVDEAKNWREHLEAELRAGGC